jgi:hypothetical protein
MWSPVCRNLEWPRTFVYVGIDSCVLCTKPTANLERVSFSMPPVMLPHVCDVCIPEFDRQMEICRYTVGALVNKHNWQDVANLQVPRSDGSFSTSDSHDLIIVDEGVMVLSLGFGDLSKCVSIADMMMCNLDLPPLAVTVSNNLPDAYFDALAEKFPGILFVRAEDDAVFLI